MGEMVKAQAGILENDPAGAAEAKLERCVGALVTEPTDAHWIAGHLRSLVGLSSQSQANTERREEALTAWRRFVEALAEAQPLVLVFEDLHWADETLLDFIEGLLVAVSGMPNPKFWLLARNARWPVFLKRDAVSSMKKPFRSTNCRPPPRKGSTDCPNTASKLFFALTSAPAAMSCRITSVEPTAAAYINGVFPRESRVLTSAPSASSLVTACLLSPRMAL